jgi:hypothetical protein
LPSEPVWKSRQPLQNWLSRLDLANLVELADLEPVISATARSSDRTGVARFTAQYDVLGSAFAQAAVIIST